MTHNVLGVRIDDIPEGEVISKISEAKKDFLVFTPGPEFLVTASKDSEFTKVLNESNLNIPDGVGLGLAGVRNRITGVDLMIKLLNLAAEKDWSVGLIGGVNGVSEKVARKFPKTKFKYTWSDEEADKIMKHYLIDNTINISSDNVDLLFVGLGHPKQEKVLFNIVKEKKGIKFKVGMGVGGSFDLIAGTKKRAPKFIQQIGMEWLWRGLQDPKHFVRIWRATGEFVWVLISSKN